MQEAIEEASKARAREQRIAARNALIAGRWVQPSKEFKKAVLDSEQKAFRFWPKQTDEEVAAAVDRIVASETKQVS